MARFHGLVGYIRPEETKPGVFTEVATDRACVGDIIRSSQRWEGSGNLNDNLTINNRFSIIGDEYAYQNLQYMRYLIWMGTKWKITSVEIERPRVILTVGGIYNG